MKKPFLNTLIVMPAVLLATCNLASAIDIDFTAPDYSDGGLDGQQGWNATSKFVVSDSAGVGVVNITNDNTTATYEAVALDFDSAAVGAVFTVYADVQWTQTGVTAANTDFFRLYYAGSNSTRASFGRDDDTVDSYSFTWGSYTSVLSGADVGIDTLTGTDAVSDVIRISYSLTKGATASTWLGSYEISNGSTIIGSDSGSTFAVAEISEEYSSLQSRDHDGGISGLNMQGYGLTTSGIPEPSTYAMLSGLLAFSWVMVRRRQA